MRVRSFRKARNDVIAFFHTFSHILTLREAAVTGSHSPSGYRRTLSSTEAMAVAAGNRPRSCFPSCSAGICLYLHSHVPARSFAFPPTRPCVMETSRFSLPLSRFSVSHRDDYIAFTTPLFAARAFSWSRVLAYERVNERISCVFCALATLRAVNYAHRISGSPTGPLMNFTDNRTLRN